MSKEIESQREQTAEIGISCCLPFALCIVLSDLCDGANLYTTRYQAAPATMRVRNAKLRPPLDGIFCHQALALLQRWHLVQFSLSYVIETAVMILAHDHKDSKRPTPSTSTIHR